jgi:hypothetical protein
MIKKIFLSLFVFTFLISCGYNPIYSESKKINFSIASLNVSGENTTKDFFKVKLKKYSKSNLEEKYYIDIKTSYNKLELSKDAAGKVINYKLVLKVDIKVKSNKINKQINMTEDFIIKNDPDDFEENRYEEAIKIELANKILNKLILQISNI